MLHSTASGWAWFGPYAHVLRGGEAVRTFRGPGCRRRAARYAEARDASTLTPRPR